MGTPTLIISSKPYYFPKAQSTNTIILEFRTSGYELAWGWREATHRQQQKTNRDINYRVTLVRKLCKSSECEACIVGAQIINPLPLRNPTMGREGREKLFQHPLKHLSPHGPGLEKENGSIYFVYSKASGGAGFMLLEAEI